MRSQNQYSALANHFVLALRLLWIPTCAIILGSVGCIHTVITRLTGLDVAKPVLNSQAPSFAFGRPIQCKIQLENVDMRFPENTELAAMDVGVHQTLDGVFGEITRGGNARHFIERGSRRNIRIQT